MAAENTALKVELLITTNCPYCASVMKILNELVKKGEIATLEIRNLDLHQELAGELNVRSVPWMRTGSSVLTGLQSEQQIKNWLAKGIKSKFEVTDIVRLLGSDQLDEAIKRIKSQPGLLPEMTVLLADLDTPFTVRIGIGAILEELSETDMIELTADSLVKMTDSEYQPARADAAYFLSFINTEKTQIALERLLTDENEEVREIARESLRLH